MNHIAEAGQAAASDSEPAALDAARAGVAMSARATGPAAESKGDARHRTDTRARIERVAIELFTEQGYEGTSLREIAERLDVTKAALYYHFKSKEDIIRSLVERYRDQMDDLVAWARAQPRNAQTRREVLTRYLAIVAGGDKVFRMLHENQAAVNAMADAIRSLKVSPLLLVDAIAGPDAPLRDRVRATMALGAVNVGWMVLADRVTDRGELSEILCDLGAEFAHCQPE